MSQDEFETKAIIFCLIALAILTPLVIWLEKLPGGMIYKKEHPESDPMYNPRTGENWKFGYPVSIYDLVEKYRLDFYGERKYFKEMGWTLIHLGPAEQSMTACSILCLGMAEKEIVDAGYIPIPYTQMTIKQYKELGKYWDKYLNDFIKDFSAEDFRNPINEIKPINGINDIPISGRKYR